MKKVLYKYKIGDIVSDVHSGKLQILEQIKIPHHRKNNNDTYEKGYHYKCLICGNEDNILEYDLNRHMGCNVCSGKKIKIGYNDIWTTNPELAKLLADPNDGYKYTQNSHKHIDFKCPECGNIIKNKDIHIIKQRKLNCPRCSDGISYPEKLIYSILKQLKIKFRTQLTKTTFNWIINNYRYDFYFKINNKEYIVESHGMEHYQYTGFKKTLQEEQLNDKNKKELALQNGIKEENYIVIDCRYSELEWIKEHILQSRLAGLFDLSKIDWLQCHKFALSSFVKKACNYWNQSMYSTVEIGEILKLNQTTINRYLKQGEKLGWCDYNPKEVKTKNLLKGRKGKAIEIFKNNISLGKFESCTELERQSKKVFGVELNNSAIAATCRGVITQYKNFTFKYI